MSEVFEGVFCELLDNLFSSMSRHTSCRLIRWIWSDAWAQNMNTGIMAINPLHSPENHTHGDTFAEMTSHIGILNYYDYYCINRCGEM